MGIIECGWGSARDALVIGGGDQCFYDCIQGGYQKSRVDPECVVTPSMWFTLGRMSNVKSRPHKFDESTPGVNRPRVWTPGVDRGSTLGRVSNVKSRPHEFENP